MFGIMFAFRFRNLYVKGTYRRNYDWIVSILWRICVSEFRSVWMASLSRPKRGNRTRQPGAISDSNDNLTEYYTTIRTRPAYTFDISYYTTPSIIIITPRRIKFSEWPDGTILVILYYSRTGYSIGTTGWFCMDRGLSGRR